MQTSDNRHFGSGGQSGSGGSSIRSSQFGPSDPNNPYGASSTMQPPPPKKSNTWLWILLGVGGVLILGCCGCAGLMYFGGQQAMNAGMSVIATQLRPKLAEDPVVQQHIGEIQSLEGDFGASIQESNASGSQGELVFNIKGTKGEGVIIGKPANGNASLENGRLRLKSGEEFPLTQ